MATAPDPQKVSDQLVRLVQIFFGLVLAQSLLLYKPLFLNPLDPRHYIAFLALAAVFYTTLSSWIDWHVTMAYRPYDTRQKAERVRVYSDVGVVVLYAYLLFTIEPLVGNPETDLGRHLAGYPAVFSFYVISGLLRRATHGKAASKLAPLIKWLTAYASLWTAYRIAATFFHWGHTRVALNTVALVSVFGLMMWYRSHRKRLSAQERQHRLLIGIDVDGVLADQIAGVLPRLRKDVGISLKYADITDWRLPIGQTDIAQEIERAHEDREYVLSMPVHEGARSLLTHIARTGRIMVVTARRAPASGWTAEWLRRNQLPYDDLVPAEEAKKSLHKTDVLVDDYLGNILEYVANSHGIGVLVDQPWNSDRNQVRPFVETGRVVVVSSLRELQHKWPEISAAAVRTRESVGLALSK